MAKQKKILIAEDEKPLSKALQIKLEKEGYSVTPTYDGSSVLEALKKDSFDLLILDLIMPNTDGFGVLEKVKKDYPDLKVVVLSNLSQESDIAKVKKLGVDDYLVKSNTSLIEVVDHISKI